MQPGVDRAFVEIISMSYSVLFDLKPLCSD